MYLLSAAAPFLEQFFGRLISRTVFDADAERAASAACWQRWQTGQKMYIFHVRFMVYFRNAGSSCWKQSRFLVKVWIKCAANMDCGASPGSSGEGLDKVCGRYGLRSQPGKFPVKVWI